MIRDGTLTISCESDTRFNMSKRICSDIFSAHEFATEEIKKICKKYNIDFDKDTLPADIEYSFWKD